MKKINKILVIAGNVILFLILIVGIMIGYTLLPIKDNYKILVVTSGSMEPDIKTGSLAVIKPSNEYSVGDIISFSRANSSEKKDLTTHRITEIVEDEGEIYYRTKGDANEAEDRNLISKDQIVGRYYFSIALLGYLIKYLKTLPGLVLIIIIPATIIIYEEIKKIRQEAKKIKEIKAKKKLNKSPKKEKK
jgi:signal peptidase I